MHLEQWSSDSEWRERGAFTVVVDGKDLCTERNAEDILSPRQQVEVLQRLVKIQEREQWDIWVLFNGEPLRQVEHGGDFMGIRVFFSPTPPQRVPTLLECVKVLASQDCATLLISEDAALEPRAAVLGAVTLRASTLKKGYDRLFVSKGRPQSRLMRHRTVDRNRSREEAEDQRSIREMIDLVDEP